MAVAEAATLSTAHSINRFEEIVKEHSTKKVGEADLILENIRKCKAANPPVFEAKRVREYLDARSKTLATLLDQYLVARLTARYPLIDESLFKMKRHLTVSREGALTSDRTKPLLERSGTDIRVDVPLFAVTKLDGNRTVELGEYKSQSTTTTRSGVLNKRRMARLRTKMGPNDSFARLNIDLGRSQPERRVTTYKGTITATLPTPPNEISIAARKALGYYYSVIGDIHSSEDLCELITKRPEHPELLVTWIPSPAGLGVKVEVETRVVMPKSNDPALILEVGERKFLVKTYDIENEEPIEYFMREFTTGTGSVL